MVSCTKDVVDTTGNLVGIISDSRSGTFLSGVSVALTPTGKTYTTGLDGKYEFRNIESQEYSVSVSKSGYQSDKRATFVQASQDTNLDFQLTPSTGNLVLSQNSIDFGNDATMLTFDIFNNGNAVLTWQLSEDASWLSCNPTSGTTQAGEKSSIVVNVDRKGLERGNYAQTIAVTSNGGSGFVDIKMNIKGINVTVSPEELDFGSISSSISLTLTNRGSGNITYSISKSNDWVHVNKTTGGFSDSESIIVSVDRTSMAEGDYYSNLSVTIGEDEILIPISMNIPSKSKPIVSLNDISNVTYSSATVKGAVVSIGSSKIYKYGACWSTVSNFNLESAQSCNFGDCLEAKDFSYTISTLQPNTTYFIKTYAENSEGVSYSNEMSVTTLGLPSKPSVETGTTKNISDRQAEISGNILNLGNVSEIIQYGHVWNKKGGPTINDQSTQLGNTVMTGPYNSTLTDLSPNSKYYVCAYATNSIGTSYGDVVEFTTAKGDIILKMKEPTEITHNQVVCEASIIYDGGRDIFESGFCISKYQKPVISNSRTVKTTNEQSFKVKIDQLDEETTYYVCAYVISSEGNIYYSNEQTFTTSQRNVHIDKGEYGDEINWN